MKIGRGRQRSTQAALCPRRRVSHGAINAARNGNIKTSKVVPGAAALIQCSPGTACDFRLNGICPVT